MTDARLFDPGPGSMVPILDRLEQELEAKYRDHRTAKHFALQAQVPNSDACEQGLLFPPPGPSEPAPQAETLLDDLH